MSASITPASDPFQNPEYGPEDYGFRAWTLDATDVVNTGGSVAVNNNSLVLTRIVIPGPVTLTTFAYAQETTPTAVTSIRWGMWDTNGALVMSTANIGVTPAGFREATASAPFDVPAGRNYYYVGIHVQATVGPTIFRKEVNILTSNANHVGAKRRGILQSPTLAFPSTITLTSGTTHDPLWVAVR